MRFSDAKIDNVELMICDMDHIVTRFLNIYQK